MKAAQVLATYFGNRRSFPFNKNGVINTINKQIETLQELDLGYDTDLLIVNHDIKDSEVYEFLSKIENIKLKNGIVKIINRSIINNDMSFGSYKYAFYKFQNEYDYWFFNEDDILPLRSKVVKEMIDMLESDLNLGFIPALNFLNSVHEFKIDNLGYILSTGIWNHPPHAHGGVGLTSKKILLKIKNIFPEYFQTPNIINENAISSGGYNGDHVEIEFTNIYVKAGYKLKCCSDGTYFKRLQDGRTL